MTMQPKSMQDALQDSYLAGDNEAYLENLYEDYLTNPDAVSASWRKYFDQLIASMPRSTADTSHAAVREQFLQLARQPAKHSAAQGMGSYHDVQQERVFELIAAYRRLGHLQANIDPLGLYKSPPSPMLDLAYYGFSDADLTKTFSTGSFSGLDRSTASLADIYQALRRTYCGTIGFEYMHINRFAEVEWLRERIEKGWVHFAPTQEEKLRLLNQLVAADGLEKYLGVKYVGQKRFSLEGGDTLVPLLDAIINRGAQQNVKEFVIGMAHRGRLNVLVNIVGKKPADIFAAFEGKGISTTHSGDVKYHLGYSSNVNSLYGPVHIALAFNPSHLEIVSPVVQGSVRARQRRRCDKEQRAVVPIQIHGDAAFAGQGVVTETFNMSQARWFTVAGSIHIVINNQVGFTISDPRDARSTLYCTDVAKMVEPPILHVNANDAEAVYFAALLAADYRHTFKRDVVIDLVCYRRHGHNEADEPSATQPLMYQVIKAMQPPYLLYANTLQQEKVLAKDAEKALVDAYRQALESGKSVVDIHNGKDTYEYMVNWEPYLDKPWTASVKTAVPLAQLKALGAALAILPEGFVLQPQVKKVLEARDKMMQGEALLNWGCAEILAYAALLTEGYPIRLCGQDAGRGTFAHRLSVLHDQNTDEIYIPLSHLSPKQAHINIVDSLLSEEAVLAFEYGYAT
ncbi:MAG TPA: 2-oxoglutarate dehydrogenase E1 component, partial [Gammaproteobacteria bacterium]|nr:2-oxoglutarate dehydrogenase E1 component [Gammaproteobacteria bacterium]